MGMGVTMTISLEHDREIVGKAVYRVSHQTTFTNAVNVFLHRR